MAKRSSKPIKKSQEKKNYNKSYQKIAFIVVFIILLIIGINIKNNPSKQNNKNTQIILNNQNITADLQEDILVEDEKIYMSFQDIKQFLDDTIYQEDETGLIITTSDKKIATMKQGEESITINGSNQKVKDIVIKKEEKIYLAISELENAYDYELNYLQNSNIVTIDDLSKKLVKAYAKKNIKIKEENKMFSKVIDKVEKGNWLIFIEEKDGIAKVRTQNGTIGYGKKSLLDNFVTEREDFIEKTSTPVEGEELEYDITKKDLSSFEKRSNIIHSILQEAIKNDKMYVKIINHGSNDFEWERFQIEIAPILQECGIKIIR